MKEQYLDIMEKALAAYTQERIRDYIDEVRRDGLSEHGFPRLAVNIGILIACGRRKELLDTFTEMMDICCDEIPKHKTQSDFSVREVCCCLMLLEKKRIVSDELLRKWKAKMTSFDPWRLYTVVAKSPDTPIGNWAMFAAVSEFVRGVYCGVDTTEFVDWQISSQLLSLDCNGMYQDDPPVKNPMVYDLVPRQLMAFLLMFGYKGKFAERIENALDSAAELTLKMQSVTGEIPYGGRSNQFLNNEPMLTAYCELEAARYARRDDIRRAGEFKAAAALAAERTLGYLNRKPISHIKNRYNISTRIGCEDYGYFNKYMITVASNIYMGYLFADDSVIPAVSPAERGGYAISTSDRFHKTFLNAGGYFIELDTNADLHYDANGLGRVHKKGCSSVVCLSVPFPSCPNYTLERENPGAMSICCYAESGGKILLGSEEYAEYELLDSSADENTASAVFSCKLSDGITIRQEYRLSENGLDISLSGAENIGFMLPVFDFDGEENTAVAVSEKSVLAEYDGSVCVYSFDGRLSPDYKYYCNRNGRYRVYSVETKHLHIGIKEESK